MWDELVAKYCTPDTLAIAYTGSLTRDDVHAYSDVDLYLFYPTPTPPHYALDFHGETLVSLSRRTIDEMLDQFRHPEQAVWAVAGIRQAITLYDPDGHFARLQQAAHEFTWEPLREAANAYVSAQMVGYIEEAYKLMGTLRKRYKSAILYALSGLVHGLPMVLVVQGGVLLTSENAFFASAERTAGLDSAWAGYFRVAAGLLEADLLERGRAALRLYVETAHLMNDILLPTDRPLVEQAVQTIERELAHP